MQDLAYWACVPRHRHPGAALPTASWGRNAGEVFARWASIAAAGCLATMSNLRASTTPLRVLALGAAIEHRGTPQARWYLLGQDALWLPLLGASPCSVDASRVELVALWRPACDLGRGISGDLSVVEFSGSAEPSPSGIRCMPGHIPILRA